MTISDIITLVSLLIAIVAILNEKNRKHLLLKFHIIDYILFSASFLLINYFVFYENFFDEGIYIKQLYFHEFGFNNPKHFAYLIAILSLFYFFYKILFSFYPNSKINSVIKFYRQLIEINETSFLLDLIDRYHKNDIIRLIEKSPNSKPNNNFMTHRFHQEKFKEKINKLLVRTIRFSLPNSWFNRKAYGKTVLHGIINDPAFIVLTSNQRPYFFAEIFAHFKKVKRNAFPDKLVNSFLSEILQHKNFWFRNELMKSKDFDYGQPDWFFEDNKILSSLLQDLSIADINQIWQPFGDIAVNEIAEERTKGNESKMFLEFREEQFLWEYKTYFAIQFFKILIVEALVKKYMNSHFWLYYYRSITDEILKTFKRYPPNDFEKFVTVYHAFIDIMVNNLFLWLRISNDKEDEWFYNNILDCLSSLIHSICNSAYYCTQKKVDYIDSLFINYCRLKSNTESEKLRTKIGQIILKPSMLFDKNDIYYMYVSVAWDKFDKIPHRVVRSSGYVDYKYFKQFKEQVIVPLGLDPDK